MSTDNAALDALEQQISALETLILPAVASSSSSSASSAKSSRIARGSSAAIAPPSSISQLLSESHRLVQHLSSQHPKIAELWRKISTLNDLLNACDRLSAPERVREKANLILSAEQDLIAAVAQYDTMRVLDESVLGGSAPEALSRSVPQAHRAVKDMEPEHLRLAEQVAYDTACVQQLLNAYHQIVRSSLSYFASVWLGMQFCLQGSQFLQPHSYVRTSTPSTLSIFQSVLINPLGFRFPLSCKFHCFSMALMHFIAKILFTPIYFLLPMCRTLLRSGSSAKNLPPWPPNYRKSKISLSQVSEFYLISIDWRQYFFLWVIVGIELLI